MAGKSKKFIAKKHKANVKKHSFVHKKTEVKDQSQDRAQTQDQVAPPQAPATPVVGSGFPQPQVQPSAPVPTIVSPSPMPSAVYNQPQSTQPLNNSTPQPQSQDAKLDFPKPSQQSKVVPSNPISGSDINSLPQEFVPEKKSKLGIFIIIGLVIASMVGGGLFYFKSKPVEQAPKKEKALPASATTSAAPASTSSAVKASSLPAHSPSGESAAQKADYSKYQIRVLNGSGITGEAAKVKAYLEEEKFVVKDIDNAESSDYEKTVIKAKKDVPKEYLDPLKKLLQKTYVLDAQEELRESASADVTIIIGSKKQ